MTKSESPKWSEWRHMPQVSLFEAVSLSLNINPDWVRLEPGQTLADLAAKDPEEFKSRLRVAERSLREVGPLHPLSPNWPYQSAVDRQVTLIEFAAWAQSLGWPIPSEMKAIAKTALIEPDYPKWLNSELWTVVEAAFLLAGIEPQDVPNIKNDGTKQAGNYRFIKDATIRGSLNNYGSPTGAVGNKRLDPAECVQWAVSRGLAIPDGLSALKHKSADKDKRAEELGERERSTLLKMILGMAIKGFDYDPTAKKNKAVPEIEAALIGAGLGVGVDTIRDKLAEATKLLEGKG